MKQRIITALLLIAVALPCIIVGGTIFKVLVGIVLLLVSYELLKLIHSHVNNIIVDIVVYLFSIIVFLFDKNMMISINYVICFLIVLYTLSIFFENFLITDVFFLFSMVTFIVVGINGAIFLRLEHGLFSLLFVVFATYGSDTGAYFVGVNLGKHKLIPRLSPNKTIEGSIGGIIFGSLLASIFAYFFEIPIPYNQALALAIILAITAQIGDLTFSNIKRYYQIKDFSNLLPGHGGILDRVDSLVFNIVIYILWISFM